MNKQTLIVVIAAIVLLGLGVFGAMAFTGSESDIRDRRSCTRCRTAARCLPTR